jgi:hypothetical protein
MATRCSHCLNSFIALNQIFINSGFLEKARVSFTETSKSEIYFLLPNIVPLTTTTSILSSSFYNYLRVMVYNCSRSCTVFTPSLKIYYFFFDIYHFLPGTLVEYPQSYSVSALSESEKLCWVLLPVRYELMNFYYSYRDACLQHLTQSSENLMALNIILTNRWFHKEPGWRLQYLQNRRYIFSSPIKSLSLPPPVSFLQGFIISCGSWYTIALGHVLSSLSH